MKRKTISLTLAIFLIGIVGATLLPQISNVVTGEAIVSGPIFYAGAENQLLINEFDDSSSVYTIDDADSERFFTMSLDDPLDFYTPHVNLFVRAQVSNGAIPKDLKLVFLYFNSDGNIKEICSSIVSIISDSMFNYDSSCEGTEELTDVKGFLYKIDGLGAPGVEYEISTSNEKTRVEVDKA